MKYGSIFTLCSLSLLLLTGCIDKNYDLSDIDTTARIEVKDLTVPINLDPITMGDIIGIKEGDKIQIVDGRYAIVVDGEFNSSPIEIEGFTIPTPYILPLERDIETGIEDDLILDNNDVSIDIKGYAVYYNSRAFQINPDIKSITDISSVCDLIVYIKISSLIDRLAYMDLSDVQLRLPKGLTIIGGTEGDYDKETGVFSIPQITSDDGYITVRLRISKIDASAGLTLDQYQHSVLLNGTLELLSAKLNLKKSYFKEGEKYYIPRVITVETSAYLSDMNVTAFSGTLGHTVTGVQISDINLTELPDIFLQDSTNITLHNPQIYLSIINPLRSFGLTADCGFTIIAERGVKDNPSFSLDKPGYFTILADDSEDEINQVFCLSPEPTTSSPEGFPHPTHVPYTSLSDVVAGNGLPDSLLVNFAGGEYSSPVIPTQPVKNFPLGYEYGSFVGSYRLIAPLDFNPGSTVVYTKTENGWSSKDLESLTITSLKITAKVSSDLPIDLTFTGQPINKFGRPIENVKIEGAVVKANAVEQDLEITVTGTITYLDGITFEACGTSVESNVLTPEMKITLTNVRPVVSGYYEKEL